MRAWLSDPLRTAAMSPSGPQLARLMVAQVPQGSGPIIELGAGTGVFTEALLAAGVMPERLLVVELNRSLHGILRQRFPQVRVECADACCVLDLAARCGIAPGSVDAIVSGLGLLSMPRLAVTQVIEASSRLLGARGRLIQFTYGPLSPVPRVLAARLGLRARRAGLAWRNMPPATVYVYSVDVARARGV
ncbi:methyltransferase domain-containing protein [Metallibacterium sp.]|uniref:class I SAM-dependent methyltransferase n=1 Tax=Metallibacterium sp. TaxID=2940281 RepID=UPI00261BA399|nr:methyltransferase domain-containing protein [Metallibacterium sp.]